MAAKAKRDPAADISPEDGSGYARNANAMNTNSNSTDHADNYNVKQC